MKKIIMITCMLIAAASASFAAREPVKATISNYNADLQINGCSYNHGTLTSDTIAVLEYSGLKREDVSEAEFQRIRKTIVNVLAGVENEITVSIQPI